MNAFPDTPVTLLARFAVEVTGESESSWAQFFALYQPAIKKFAELAGAGDEAEDVAQEVFVKLLPVLRQGAYQVEKGRFRSYLATIIRREVTDLWRKGQVRAVDRKVSLNDDDHPLEIAVPAVTPIVLDAKWQLACHAAAVEHVLTKTALSAQSRAVYRAYVLDGRPIEEVAAEFNLTNNAVSQIKTRVTRMIDHYEAVYSA
ncbi:MAG: sigma-70 family RNA polymerase sigma factor [Kiritimatiellae bacterium]|nr:sigma-70 family RNA polymerase sigma factor [Kiritimatiellia bacterium]